MEILVVEDLDGHVVVAFVGEVNQAPNVDVVLAGEDLLDGGAEHPPNAVVPDLDGPLAVAAACFPQVHLGWLPAVEEVRVLEGEPFRAKWGGGDVEHELKVVDVAAHMFR